MFKKSAVFLLVVLAFMTLFAEKKKLYVLITVDWEGSYLFEENVAEMESFKNDYPEIPVLHYLNAAYFVKPDADKSAVREAINRCLKPNDEHGLHIHGWKRLFEYAGVKHKISPRWWRQGDKLTAKACEKDCGHGIPINAFNEEELRLVIKKSIDILTENGFRRPVSFRSGGWMISNDLANALHKEGITSSSAAVPPIFLEQKLSKYLIYHWIHDYWHWVTPLSQPFRWKVDDGYLLEMPDNACLADYVNGSQIISVIKSNIEVLKNSNEAHRVVVTGYHHESARKFIGNVREMVEWVKAYEGDVDIEFITSPLVAVPGFDDGQYSTVKVAPEEALFISERESLFIF